MFVYPFCVFYLNNYTTLLLLVANNLTNLCNLDYTWFMNCNLCPRQCNTNRNILKGYCQKDNKIEISKVMLHFGEEPFLAKENKSGAIFFAGCNLRCVYCQNFEISRGYGKKVSPKGLANLFKQLEDAGANNIDLVTPTQYTKQIIDALKIYKPKIPVIYNCGGYELPSVIKNLCKYIDIFLFDLKYCDNSLSLKYSSAANYFEYATSSILAASQNKPNRWKNNLLMQGVAIRHLCLPSHTQDSKNVIDWISKNTKAF